MTARQKIVALGFGNEVVSREWRLIGQPRYFTVKYRDILFGKGPTRGKAWSEALKNARAYSAQLMLIKFES